MEVSIGKYRDIIYKRWIFQQAMFDYQRVFTNITGNTPYGSPLVHSVQWCAALETHMGMLGNQLVYHASFSSIGCKNRGLGFDFHGEKLVDQDLPGWNPRCHISTNLQAGSPQLCEPWEKKALIFHEKMNPTEWGICNPSDGRPVWSLWSLSFTQSMAISCTVVGNWGYSHLCVHSGRLSYGRSSFFLIIY